MSQSDPSLRTILAEALALTDAQQRAAYLATACGNDAALRKEVEELIRAQCEAGKFHPCGGRCAIPPFLQPGGLAEGGRQTITA